MVSSIKYAGQAWPGEQSGAAVASIRAVPWAMALNAASVTPRAADAAGLTIGASTDSSLDRTVLQLAIPGLA